MSSTDYLSTATETPAPQPQQPPLQGLISFLCPLCHERLNVPNDFAGVAAACPACSELIRAPRETAQPSVSSQMRVTGSENSLTSEGQGLSSRLSGNSALTTTPLVQPATMLSPSYGSGFSAVKKIEAPESDALDESWRAKVERDKKKSRRRHSRDRWLEMAVNSPQGEKIQRIGIILITTILVITIGGLYLNRRSGGELFRKLFG